MNVVFDQLAMFGIDRPADQSDVHVLQLAHQGQGDFRQRSIDATVRLDCIPFGGDDRIAGGVPTKVRARPLSVTFWAAKAVSGAKAVEPRIHPRNMMVGSADSTICLYIDQGFPHCEHSDVARAMVPNSDVRGMNAGRRPTIAVRDHADAPGDDGLTCSHLIQIDSGFSQFTNKH